MTEKKKKKRKRGGGGKGGGKRGGKNFKAIQFIESAAFCRVGRVTGNNNKFLLGLSSLK